jgi:hypothetical protein
MINLLIFISPGYLKNQVFYGVEYRGGDHVWKFSAFTTKKRSVGRAVPIQ